MTAAPNSIPNSINEALGIETRRKITRRLIPFLFALYVFSFLDRVNVGFAGLDMTRELGFSNTVFGFGSGIFFVGYCLLEIPGGLLSETWSTRKWIACIMIAWGLLAGFTGLIRNATEFSIIRFLLGTAEGGFFPAVLVYLTHWFRARDRAKAIAMFMTGVPVASVVGAPISGMLMRVHWFGVAGWRWLLILEGLPAALGGLACLYYLTDRPADAKWLLPEERQWITDEIAREKGHLSQSHGNIRAALREPLVIAFALSYFCTNLSLYGLGIWLPKIVQKLSGLGSLGLGFLIAVPYLISVPAMLFSGWRSDHTGHHRRWAAGAAFTAAVGVALSQLVGQNPALSVAAFAIAAIGIMSYYPPLLALPSRILTGRGVAASFGIINLIANLGGFVGPYLMGFLTDLTHNYSAGLYVLVASSTLSGLILVLLRDHRVVGRAHHHP